MKDINAVMPCPRGLEEVLRAEAQTLVAQPCVAGRGMVRVRGIAPEDIYLLNLHMRTASRILIEAVRFSYACEDDIFRAVKAFPWDSFFSPDLSIKVHIEAHNSPVKSLNFVALRVKDAVCDAFREKTGRRPDVDKAAPDMRIYVFLNERECFVYLDSSGEALFKRGYRREKGVAPLRENLAAGLLLLAGFDGSQNFFDPMCGSGTVAIEAAWLAQRRAPGLMRSFAFEKMRDFRPSIWQSLRERAQESIIKPAGEIIASDIDSRLTKAALSNARAAAVDDVIRFRTGDFIEAEAPAPTGILLTNPPYGERLGDRQELAARYPGWGSTLKNRFAGWTAGIISADRSLPHLMRLSPKRKIPVYNGKLDCRLYLFDMVEGSHRKTKEKS